MERHVAKPALQFRRVAAHQHKDNVALATAERRMTSDLQKDQGKTSNWLITESHVTVQVYIA